MQKPPARADFPVIEDGNNKTKDRFLPSRNSLSASQPKQHTKFKANIPLFFPHCLEIWKRKSCHDFPQFYQVTLLFLSALTNDGV